MSIGIIVCDFLFRASVARILTWITLKKLVVILGPHGRLTEWHSTEQLETTWLQHTWVIENLLGRQFQHITSHIFHVWETNKTSVQECSNGLFSSTTCPSTEIPKSSGFNGQMDDVLVFIFSIWCHFLFFAISWAFTIMPFRRVCRLTWLDAWVIASFDSLCGKLGDCLLNFTCTCGSANRDMRENWKPMFPKRSPKSSTIWIFFCKLVHLWINLLNLLFWRFCVTFYSFYHGINHQYTNLVEICICLVLFFLIVLAKQNRSLAAFLFDLPFQLLRDVGTQPLGHIFTNIWACDCKGASFDSKLFWHIFLLMSLFWNPYQDMYIIQKILYLEPKWPLFWMDEAFFWWVQTPK